MDQFFDRNDNTFQKLATFIDWSQKHTFTFYLIILGRPFLDVFFVTLLYTIIWRLQVFAPSFFVRDQIREFNSPPTDIGICYTPPRSSELSEKNLEHKDEAIFWHPIFDTNLCWKYEENPGHPLRSTSQSDHNLLNWAVFYSLISDNLGGV